MKWQNGIMAQLYVIIPLYTKENVLWLLLSFPYQILFPFYVIQEFRGWPLSPRLNFLSSSSLIKLLTKLSYNCIGIFLVMISMEYYHSHYFVYSIVDSTSREQVNILWCISKNSNHLFNIRYSLQIENNCIIYFQLLVHMNQTWFSLSKALFGNIISINIVLSK